MADNNYLLESITNPDAKVVAGWEPIMPSFEGQIEAEEINVVIAFIKTLKRGETNEISIAVSRANFQGPLTVKFENLPKGITVIEDKKITAEQAELARTVPMADDITVEADSGGHTDNRPLICMIPAFMEPRSVVVDPTGEQLTMWSATQIPHILRFALAATTGVPESKIRVIAPDVGGGFGGKLQTTPEEWIVWALARRLGKPVKYTETRSESLMSGHHGRDQWQKLTLSAKKDGTVTGLKVELLADLGAYVAIVGGGVPVLGAFMFNAIYKFPAYHFACQTVLTNKTWTDAYRGAGRPEATFGIERMMDELMEGEGGFEHNLQSLRVVDVLDHTYINETIPISSAENIACA